MEATQIATAGRTTGRARRMRVLAPIVGALLSAVVMGAMPATTAAASYPPFGMEKVWCAGGGNGSPDFDYIQPYIPIIYAFNTRPGIVETQNVAWRVRLNRWDGYRWIVDPERGGWSQWFGFQTFDTDYPGRFLGGTYTMPSNLKMFVPRLGYFYAVTFQPAWQNMSTGAWTYGPETWVQYHVNLVGGTPIPDYVMGYYGCRFIKDVGSVSLPSLHI
jgi:hypothetical protein